MVFHYWVHNKILIYRVIKCSIHGIWNHIFCQFTDLPIIKLNKIYPFVKHGVVVCPSNIITICISFLSNDLPSSIAIPSCKYSWIIYIIVIHLRRWDLAVQSSNHNGVLIVFSISRQTTLLICGIVLIHLIQGCILQIYTRKIVWWMSGPRLSLMLLSNYFLTDMWTWLVFTSYFNPRHFNKCITSPFPFMRLAVISGPTSIAGPK